MFSSRLVSDYEPVTPSQLPPELDGDDGLSTRDFGSGRSTKREPARPPTTTGGPSAALTADSWQASVLKRGHALSYVGLFLFSLFVYFRPYESFSALSALSSAAYYIAIVTIAIFLPSQLGLEGTLTIRPREVNLVLLLSLGALLSIPLALNRGEAWDTFVEYFKVVLMFIVLVNVVRTERRLRLLILLLLAGSGLVAISALGDYSAGRLGTGGVRIAGAVGGLLGNPNDLAMHLATMVPLAVSLFLVARGPHKKIVYGVIALLMSVGAIVTYSRGGFLGLACAGLILAWKLGRRNRLAVIAVTLMVVIAFLAFAPGEYAGRLSSIVDQSRDTVGSSSARQALLFRSIYTTIRHPLFGVGMGNFHIVSIHEQVSHNAYTQIGAELGIPSMIAYILFILTPFKRLRRIERETLNVRGMERAYYFAVGLQASLCAYMVSSFFGSVAYSWYVYYLVGFGFCFYRLHEVRMATQKNQPDVVSIPMAAT